ncbi:hypothetical protein L2E82_08326 [Cichorium intybus]|uniref:Uncharacterized protein n=1 Tax=Cichorium intybus TaxID=13427 RepID=A0ACB9G772_CICIN|nr:hypothetical protein L2E82_08326 [Cichorium intybus]
MTPSSANIYHLDDSKPPDTSINHLLQSITIKTPTLRQCIVKITIFARATILGRAEIHCKIQDKALRFLYSN